MSSLTNPSTPTNLVAAKHDYTLQGVPTTVVSADSLTTEEASTEDTCRQILLKFEDALSDDLNTPRAVAELFSLVSYAEKLISSGVTLSSTQAGLVLQTVFNMDLVFGLFYSVPSDYFPDFGSDKTESSINGDVGSSSAETSVPEAVIALAQSRVEAKKNKQFTLADSLRDQIGELGFIVKDKKDGFDLMRK